MYLCWAWLCLNPLLAWQLGTHVTVYILVVTNMHYMYNLYLSVYDQFKWMPDAQMKLVMIHVDIYPCRSDCPKCVHLIWGEVITSLWITITDYCCAATALAFNIICNYVCFVVVIMVIPHIMCTIYMIFTITHFKFDPVRHDSTCISYVLHMLIICDQCVTGYAILLALHRIISYVHTCYICKQCLLAQHSTSTQPGSQCVTIFIKYIAFIAYYSLWATFLPHHLITSYCLLCSVYLCIYVFLVTHLSDLTCFSLLYSSNSWSKCKVQIIVIIV